MPLGHFNNTDLFYAEKGAGEPLLFLGGLGGDHLYWLGQMRAFGKRYRCLAPDNRDTGQSCAAPGPYVLADLAADLMLLLRHLELPAVHVVGLSMGGAIALELALAHPDVVQSLVLVSTWARTDDWFRSLLAAFELIRQQVPDTGRFFEAVLPWWVSHRFFQDSGRISWLRWLLQQTPHGHGAEAFRRQLDALRTHDVLAQLPRLQCPVLILAGQDDTIAPERYSRELRDTIPQARICLVPEVGHALPLENPAFFNAQVGSFLESLRVPQRRIA
jgi:pimeloyl-ACP methyl ester carboxylesterase